MLIGLFIGQFLAGLCFHKFTDDLDFVVEHFLGQAGVGAEEGGGQIFEGWMLDFGLESEKSEGVERYRDEVL